MQNGAPEQDLCLSLDMKTCTCTRTATQPFDVLGPSHDIFPSTQHFFSCLGSVLTFDDETAFPTKKIFEVQLKSSALLSVGADIWFSPRAESGDELRPFDHNHKVVSANAHLCPPGKSS
jgi:hypothetical protein